MIEPFPALLLSPIDSQKMNVYHKKIRSDGALAVLPANVQFVQNDAKKIGVAGAQILLLNPKADNQKKV